MPYQHLNAVERQVIQRAHAAGESFTAIAKTLGRSVSKISREWHRNARSGRYQASQVQHKAEHRSNTPHMRISAETIYQWVYRDAGRNKQVSTFTAITHALLHWVPKPLCQTLTLDNGTKNAGHERITQPKGMAVYFADPHAPWQRGRNEKINGLIRRYFPKGTDFRKVSDAQVEQVVLAINQRPRKCLHYQSPYDVFAEALRGALLT